MKKRVTTQQLVTEMAMHLTNVINQYLENDRVKNHRDKRVSDLVATAFLSTFVFTLVKKELNTAIPEGLTEEEAEAVVFHDFRALKDDVQNAVSSAFQVAMSEYAGKRVEYYCTIAPIPDPVSKLVC